ncbi:MAG: GIY-YIG nuclease family protein [Chloroflexota bacterium]
MPYCYIVKCSDGTLYTGWTTDVDRRLKQHNAGRGAKYTRDRCPVKLVYAESLPNRSAAQKRELAIKRLPRAKKLALVRSIRKSGSRAVRGLCL